MTILEKQLKNGIKLRLRAFERGILHLQAGGLDGFQESLLDRYGFIEKLPETKDCVVDKNSLNTPAGLKITLNENLGFEVTNQDETLCSTLPESKVGTAPTKYGNAGYQFIMPLAEKEKLVGFGDHYRQGFLLNGRQDTLWIRYPVKHVPVPFFMSSRGYGIFFNTTRKLTYDIASSAKNEARIYVPKDYLDAYIIVGDSYAEMIDRYTDLTGKPNMPPLKSFGLWLLMHSVATGHDVINIARTLRQEGIPCDNISLEPDWMEQRYDFSTEKEWNSDRFRAVPQGTFRRGPDRMIQALNRMGYDLGLWLCCKSDLTWEEERRLGKKAEVITPGGGKLQLDGIEIGHQDDNVGHSPIWMDETTKRNEAWFEHLKKFVDDGVRFFKMDPAILINEFPDRLYSNGCRDDEMHNIVFMLCSKQMCNDYEAFTKQRSYGISIAGWAGFQRFPGTWAGDTGGGAQSMVGILQDAVMGHSYATCDMETFKVSGIHMGFFLPWALINSWASFHYPGYQGDEIDSVYRDYSRLRMSLLPYLYSLAFEASRTAKAIARPMLMEYPEVDQAYELTQQYMLGDSMLISVYAGDRINLPKGRWYDYWNNTIVEGNWEEISLPFPKNRGGHLLIREGALIPTIEPMQHTGEKEITDIEWLLFPNANPSSFTLYLDDGNSLGYRDEKYACATLTASVDGNEINSSWSKISGKEPERIKKLNNKFRILK